MRRAPWVPVFLSLLLAGVGPLPAAGWVGGAPGQERDQAGESLQVFLLTLGQGEAIWERFGHNALWIRDRYTGDGAAYNWGIFSFHQEGFIPRLIRGTMLYYMAPADAMAMMEEARAWDRKIWIQELALSPAQKLELLGFVEWNALPENRDYRYDYYRDNCSTRVRDALDRVLGGRLGEASKGVVTPYSFRWHTRRLLGDRPAPYLGIQFVLGPEADRPITGWEEMFLPLRLRDWVGRVEVPDGEGGMTPLVMREEVVADSRRPSAPQEPPFALPWFLLAAVLWGGGALASAGLARGQGRVRRLPVCLLACGWAMVAAVSGSVLLGAWAFTDHFFWYRNMNLLQVNPLFLPIPAPFLLFLFRGSFPRWGRDMVAALVVVSLVGWAMQLLPVLRQHNGEVLAFTLPMNLTLWLAAVRLHGASNPAAVAVSDPEPAPGKASAPHGDHGA